MTAGIRPIRHLGHREQRLRHRNRDVGAGDEADGAGKGRAVHARQRRLGAGVDHLHERAEPFGVGAVFCLRIGRHAAHPVEIGAGAEGRAIGPQEDGAHLRIAPGVAVGGREVRDQRIVEGVVQLGTVQGEDRDALLMGDEEAHIRNTPKRVSLAGALREADKASASTIRVSTGSITPSSHSRAEE